MAVFGVAGVDRSVLITVKIAPRDLHPYIRNAFTDLPTCSMGVGSVAAIAREGTNNGSHPIIGQKLRQG